MDEILSFFVENFPSGKAILLGGPLGIIWSLLCLHIAGYLKGQRGWRTGFTRKVFHFLIFGTASGLQVAGGTPLVCLFGGMTSVVLLYAILRGAGDPLYEALARESDSPHRTYCIVVPYLATLLGGLASNILFGPAAVFGYLVAGLGDAIAEPVGTAFGRHRYRVPSFRGVETTRSLEGSASVFVASAAAIGLGVLLLPSPLPLWSLAMRLPLIALGCAVIEGVSPHGWDNATMQILPAWMAVAFLQ